MFSKADNLSGNHGLWKDSKDYYFKTFRILLFISVLIYDEKLKL